jgi:branched-chain amino acid transport system substrate-binding protein
MPANRSRAALTVAATFAFAASCSTAFAQKKYDTGASDTEIKIGNIMPYSGPASAYGVIGKTEEAYFKMINEQGGINGRKITYITYDDGYSPPKAVEQARKLVESDEVLFIASALGTPSNTAIQKYMNAKKVPQLFRRDRRHASSANSRTFRGRWAGSPPIRASRASMRRTC